MKFILPTVLVMILGASACAQPKVAPGGDPSEAGYDQRPNSEWLAIAAEQPAVKAKIRETLANRKTRATLQWGIHNSVELAPSAARIFENQGVDPALIWLAQVESRWIPSACVGCVPQKHADGSIWYKARPGDGNSLGLFQLKPRTARGLGLRVSSQLDERLDPQRSAEAAARYLSKLLEIFEGKVPLALAAYNMGDGGLKRTLDQTVGASWKTRSFWSYANRLPERVRAYVVNVISTALIGTQPAVYGLESGRALAGAPVDAEVAPAE